MDNINSNDFTINPLGEKSKKIDLIKQELDNIVQQQVLVQKRIIITKECMQEIPNTDPQYAILKTRLEMNQIELDELKIQELSIRANLRQLSKE